MKNMQKYVIELLEGYANEAGNTVTVEYNWSNTGRFFVFLPDGPKSMKFSFQSEYLDLNGRGYWYTKHWNELCTALRNFATTGEG